MPFFTICILFMDLFCSCIICSNVELICIPPYELREVFKCNECLVDQFILFFVYLKSVLQLTFLRLLDQNRALVLSLSVPINICFKASWSPGRKVLETSNLNYNIANFILYKVQGSPVNFQIFVEFFLKLQTK